MNKLIFCMVLLSAALLPPSGGAQSDPAGAKLPTDFYKLRSVYFDQIKLLEEKRGRDLEEAAQQHLVALQNLEKSYQESGELKPLLAVREERNRFTANPNVRDVKVSSAPPMLGTIQQQLIDKCKEIQVACAQGTLELSQHYKRALTALQKDLTREGRIDEALAILSKVDEVDTSPEVATAKKQIASGGTEPMAPLTTTPERKTLDTTALSAYFRAEVVRWNSITQEITLMYDFKDGAQLQHWEGAEIDPLRQRMVCDRKTVRFSPAFMSVSKIECESALYSGNGPLRIVLGGNLYVDLEPGTDGSALIYQGTAAFPVMKSHGGAQPYMKYISSLSIDGETVQWSMGTKSFPASKLQQQIPSPLRIEFGHADAKAMFGNIAITGILAPEVLNAIP